MDRSRRSQFLEITLIAVCLAIGFGLAWYWRARIASDPSSAATSGSCFLYYRIGEGSLRIQTPNGVTRVFDRVTSGDGDLDSIAKRNRGPLPPGAYVVLTRDRGEPTYDGQSAFILDPIDGLSGNDRIDGLERENGGGRSAFRIHGGIATQGCLASERIGDIADLLLPHASAEGFDIYSRPADSGRQGMKRFRLEEQGGWQSAPEDGDWELFEQERRVGLLWVVP